MGNMLTTEKITVEYDININKMSLVCVIMLFILRVPLLGFSGFIVNDKSMSLIYTIFMIGTYFFSALFLWLERGNLKDYHVDIIAIIIFALGPFWYLYSNLIIRIPMMIIGIGLLIALKISKCKFQKVTLANIKWILIGLAIGAITAIISSPLLSKQVTNTGMKATASIVVMSFLTQLTNAAIFEEPFFRGILWGVLKKYKCKDLWICLIQAVLFWISHIYYINSSPYSFWIVVPLGGVVLGVLSWRSRSIGTSMAAHGMINGLGQVLTFYKF